MSSKQNNYQYGPIQFKCLINRNIPFYDRKSVKQHIIFTQSSIKSFQKKDIQEFSYVKGLDGVYLKQRYNYMSNFLYDIKDVPIKSNLQRAKLIKNSGGKNLPPPSTDITKDLPKYNRQQSFKITDPVFASNKYRFAGDVNGGDAKWGIASFNQASLDPRDDDSAIPQQSNGNIDFMHQSQSNETQTFGIHWRLTKNTPLFQGQDFVVSLKQTALSRDTARAKSKRFDAPVVKPYELVLDANYQQVGSQQLPINAGIVQYDKVQTNNGVVYQKVKDSGKQYDFCSQAYLVIAMGPRQSSQYYYIVITQKGVPIFIASDGKSSICLGKYDIQGDALLKNQHLTITVRNHLGDIVIYFNKNQDHPWIVKRQAGLFQASDGKVSFKDLNIVPSAPIQIWGGNMSSAINFSPLVYSSSAVLRLPPPPKISQKATQAHSFQAPTKDQQLIKCVLSDTQGAAMDTKSTTGAIYTCDAGRIFQVNSDSKMNGWLGGTRFLRDYGKQNRQKSYIKLDMFVTGAGSGAIQTQTPQQQCTSFTISASMIAGNHIFGVQPASDIQFELKNCKTPIMTGIRILFQPTTKQIGTMIDASKLVTEYSDSWAANDYHSIQHTGRIKFLINQGMQNYDSTVKNLVALQKRGSVFYIQVYAGYAGCNFPGSKFSGCRKDGNLIKLFTGLCFGASITMQAGKRFMSAQIVDYQKVLQDTVMMNSPFYDGVRDVNVIYDLMQMASFSKQPNDPCHLIKNYVDNYGSNTIGPDGTQSSSQVYILPNSYARLSSPFWKMQDASRYWQNMVKLTKLAGKVIFFDCCGVLHYDVLPYNDILYGNGGVNSVQPNWKFTSSACDQDGKETFLVFQQVQLQRDVQSVVNSIVLITGSPDFKLNVNSSVNASSINKPDSQGYVGYIKMYLQQDGIFGNQQSLQSLQKHYKKFFKAPVIMKWKSMSVPVRALDICCIDGQKVIATNVSTTISAADNSWWTDIQGQWYSGYTYSKI